MHVHTRSIDSVLSPIAEQVSQLIVLDEQARQHGMAMPDLTPVRAPPATVPPVTCVRHRGPSGP